MTVAEKSWNDEIERVKGEQHRLLEKINAFKMREKTWCKEVAMTRSVLEFVIRCSLGRSRCSRR